MGKKKKGSIYLDLTSNNDNLQETSTTNNEDDLEINESQEPVVSEFTEENEETEVPVVIEPEVVKETELLVEPDVPEVRVVLEPDVAKEPEVSVVVEPDLVKEPEVSVVVEPDLVKEPEVPEVPVVVEPEVVKEPEVPEVVVEPEVPEVIEPEVVKEPEVVVEPEVVKEPEVPDVAIETEVPEVVKETNPIEPEVVKELDVQEVVKEANAIETIVSIEPETNEKEEPPAKINENNTNIDYTENALNGYYSYVIACEKITMFQCVEVLLSDGILKVRPTIPSSTNSFFGVSQNDGDVGQKIKVLTKGISKLRLRTNINLPAITKMNGQLALMRDKMGKVITQSISIPVNKNDLLVLAGTSSDILLGPSTQYYQYNALGNDGLLSVYKSIQINPSNGTYNINYSEQNTALRLKLIQNGRFIQVLDINNENGEIIGYV